MNKSFKERTKLAWEKFLAKEEMYRSLAQNELGEERGGEVFDELLDLFDEAIDGIVFEIGFNGEKTEIIFSPHCMRTTLFMLDYFVSHAPETVKKNWNLIVGRKMRMENGAILVEDQKVSGADVKVLLEPRDGQVGLTLYCEKLIPLLQEDEYRAWFLLQVLTDQVIGELTVMAYVNGLSVSEEPLGKNAISLNEVLPKLEEMDMPEIKDHKRLMEFYSGYKMDPDDDPMAPLRMDVIIGSHRCLPLLESYFTGNMEEIDYFETNGAHTGFLYYPIDELDEEGENSEAIFRFREGLEKYLEENCKDEVTLLGGATGIYSGYVDLIAWDLEAVLKAAEEFFRMSRKVVFAGYQFYRKEEEAIMVYERKAISHKFYN